ncbi:CPBP family intramembrane metalloprotease [Xanthomonadaceae bacterium JHOS43]|nr:CPBP family intramembrane metalloprotease [Xanthomonadaceae bacterium JHOS43]
MDALIFAMTFCALAFAVFLLARFFDRRITFAMAALAAVYLGLDDLITGLASSHGALAFLGGNWNWTGKAFSLVLSVIVILALRIHPRAMGLTLEQQTPMLAIVAVLGFIVWGACLGLLFQPGVADAETLAFQATMPGLSEELVYRGIAPAIVLGFISGKRGDYGIPWAVILATAVLFGVWHSLGYAGGAFRFDPMSGLFPFIGSIAGGWLRFKTGSLLVPVFGHCLANTAFHLAGGVVA